MRLLKNNVLLRILNSYVVDSPEPANISYLWNFGSLLGICLVIQILTGCFLAMHYTPHVDFAFNSVEHIMRDVNNGWIIRYVHANVASFFFIFVYSHVGRGLYYSSYKSPRVLLWSIGVIILILMMAIAFLGYIRSLKWFKYEKTRTKNTISLNNFCSSFSNNSKRLYNSFNNYDNNNCNNDRSVVPTKIVEEFLKDKNLKPVFIYENLKIQDVKDKIKNNTKDLSGIYLILNKSNLDYYIGSASTGKFYTRFYRHLINLTGSKIVKLAVKKYGIDNFAFLVLELFPEKVNVENNKKLLDLEDFYLKSLLPNYNILTEAGSSFGYKHTEITRIKMKASYSDERREAIGNLNKGKTISEETKKKLRKSALSRVRPTFSEKALLNMRKKSKPIILYNIKDNTVYGEFNTITEAAHCINCNVKTIRRSLQTYKKILLRRWIVNFK